ncbi:MAG: WhiB family transcriptional regulator [Nocardioidaceae bacterium]
MREHPSRQPLADLRDELLAGAHCLYDPQLHSGPPDLEAEDLADRAAREAVAREVCTSCPVRAACLVYALRTRPADGVWAGFTADQVAAAADAATDPRSGSDAGPDGHTAGARFVRTGSLKRPRRTAAKHDAEAAPNRSRDRRDLRTDASSSLPGQPFGVELPGVA